MALTFDDGFLDPYATQAAHDAELAEQRRKEEEAARRAADLRARLAADAEAQARINTPVAPTSTPTLSQPDYTAQNGFLAPQPTGGASLAPSGAELATPNTVQALRDKLARDQAIAEFTSSPQWQAFNRVTDVFQGGQGVAADLIRRQQEAQNQYAQETFQGVLPQIQQTGMQNAFISRQQGAGLDQAFAQPDFRSLLEPQAGQSLPNFGQTLGQTGPDFGWLDKSLSTVGNLFDTYSESGIQALQNSLTSGSGGFGSTIAPGLPASRESFEAGALDSPNAFLTVQSRAFQERPLEQQIAGGWLIDPLAAAPVVGFADDISDIVRLGGAIGRKAGIGAARGGREVLEAGARQAITPPTPTGRLGAGAIDPATGRPFDYAPVLGATDDLPSPVGPASPFPAPPALTRPDLPLGRITEPASPTPIRTPTSPTAKKVQDIMDTEPLPPSRVLRRDELRGQRAGQFGRQDEAVRDAAELGLTGPARTAYIMSAMKVEDPIGRANRVRRLQTEFSPEEIADLHNELYAARAEGRIDGGEFAQAAAALKTMFDEGALPFQSQSDALGKAVGLDIISRESTIARLGPADEALVRQAPEGEIRIRQLEVRAEKQADLAADLRRRADARPTSSRLREAADMAQRRAITLQNAADEAELARTTRLLEKVTTRQTRERLRAGEKAVTAASKQAESTDFQELSRIRKEIAAGNDLSPEDLAIIERAGRGERGIIRLEREAAKLDEVAERLEREAAQRSATDPRFEKQAFEVRTRAAAKRAEADVREQLLVRREIETAAQRAERIKQEEIRKANKRAGIEQIRKDMALPNHEEILRQAKKLLNDNFPESEALNQQALEAVDIWLRGNREVLDTIGEPSSELLSSMAGVFTGNYDSYTTALIHRRDIIKGVLGQLGIEPEAASKAARALVEHELMRRYNGVLPPRVKAAAKKGFEAQPVPERTTKALQNTKGGRISEGFGEFNQMWKNTAFSLFDVGVAGLNLLDLMIKQGPLAMVGLVNRLAAAANHPMVLTQMADSSLPKVIQNQIDGLTVGSMSRTGIVDIPEAGSFFKFIPKVGPKIDELIDAKSWLEFGLALGTFKQLAQEGGLVLARAAGSDIQDARVRRNISHLVNVSSGAGRTAVRGSRKAAERGALLSAPLTRAQFQYFGELARILSPSSKVTREQRLLAALSGATYALAVGAMGKFINDRIGVGDYEANPLKPGFGIISLPNGVSISVVPQAQLLKTLGRSVEVLMDGIQGEDAGEIRDLWAKFAMGRSSPIVQSGLKLGDWGYDPNAGWRLGDWGEGMTSAEQWASAAPIPPVFAAGLQEGFDTTRTGFELLGVPAFEESVFSQQQRAFKEWVDELSPAERAKLERDLQTNTDGEITLENARFTDLPKGWQQKFQEAKPDAYEAALAEDAEKAERGDDDAERRVRARQIQQEFIIDPLIELEEEYNDGLGMPGSEALSRRRDIMDKAIPRLAETWRDLPDREARTLLQEYQDVINANEAQGEIDWDAVEAWVADLPAAKQKLIDEHTGLGYTELDREIRRDMAFIADAERSIALPGGGVVKASYFDLEEAAWDTLGPPIVDALKNLGITGPDDSPDEFWSAVYQDLAAEYGQADAVVRLRILRSPYEQAITQVKQKYRTDNEDVLKKLQKWGIGGLTQAEVGR